MAYPVLMIGATGSAVRVLQADLTRKGFGLVADGQFGAKTQAQVKRFQARHGLAADGIVGPRTWALILQGFTKPTEQPPSLSAHTMADIAYRWATAGHRYVWGGKAIPLAIANPGGMDCSGLAEWAVFQASGHSWVAGSRYQAAATHRISVAQAIATKGALLFISSTGTYSGVHHVAVSMGNGKTAEARGVHVSPNCGSFNATGRFNLAGLVPVLRYA